MAKKIKKVKLVIDIERDLFVGGPTFGYLSAEIFFGRHWIKEICCRTEVRKLLECIADSDDLVAILEKELK